MISVRDKAIYSCLLSFDVEEWFQVENLKDAIPRDDWINRKSTVADNTRKILHILEDHHIKATFFVLGWAAERNANLIREIHGLGHEVASHGYGHQLATKIDDESRLKDISQSKQILEMLIQEKVVGYRAPNFSIHETLLSQLKNLGFLYDSSQPAVIVVVGFATAATEVVSKEAALEAVETSVPEALVDLNRKAFEKGYEYFQH